ncbi:FMN reductase (NADH) RutF [Capillimicrobium parvum]|uniref:FMN reductase (NADH) RutF n=2 Tax=Capillimicrobium parvum TaxID=2884022 RepID=A0A9E6XSD8_9ACTN|nr:FMN reductase (NADH) RutF [Capillimicrobium parvum]
MTQEMGFGVVADGGGLRRALGGYPTGVCVVTGIAEDGLPHGLVTSRFIPVSIDPPLVAFVPPKDSPAWVEIAARRTFCVNVLSAQQEHLSRQFAVDAPHQFATVQWHPSSGGAPVIDGVVAWMECALDRVDDTGDHQLVVGRVRAVGENDGVPLVSCRGGFGRFAALSLAARGADLMNPLNLVDRARAEMESAAEELGGRVVAQTLVDNEVVFIASAGNLPDLRSTVAMTIGSRIPAIPPLASLFMAWEDPDLVEIWLGFVAGEEARQSARLRLEQVRARGYSVYLADPANPRNEQLLRMMAEQRLPARAEELSRDQLELIENLTVDVLDFSPRRVQEVDWLAVPVFGPDGRVSFVLGLEGLPFPTGWQDFERRLARLEQAASNVTYAIGGQVPV